MWWDSKQCGVTGEQCGGTGEQSGPLSCGGGPGNLWTYSESITEVSLRLPKTGLVSGIEERGQGRVRFLALAQGGGAAVSWDQTAEGDLAQGGGELCLGYLR